MATVLWGCLLIQVYRIADARHPIWSGQGAALFGGRWNNPGESLIYTSLSYACAMLEVLIHSSIGRVPKNHKCVVATIGSNVSVERHDKSTLPAGWGDRSGVAARRFGDDWIREARSAVLIIPSAVASFEFNALINPVHPDFTKITVEKPIDVVWDPRLFDRN